MGAENTRTEYKRTMTLLALPHCRFLTNFDRKGCFCPFMDLFLRILFIGHSKSVPATGEKNKTKKNHGKLQISFVSFKCFVFVCLDLVLIICQPHRISLCAFMSNMDFIPHLLIISCRWIRLFRSALWNGKHFFLSDPCLYSVHFRSQMAFSSERKINFLWTEGWSMAFEEPPILFQLFNKRTL